MFNKKNKRRFDLGFANVIPLDNSNVEGILYKISEDDFISLDRYEGYPVDYDKQIFQIRTKDGESSAWVYSAKKTVNGLLPTKNYLDNIIDCKLLSDDYKKKVQSVFNFLQWFKRSKKIYDPFHKFEDLWKSFNGYASVVFKPIAKKENPSASISENLIIKTIKESEKIIRIYEELLENQDFSNALKAFRKTIHKDDGYYIIRMDNDNKVKFNDIDNFGQFIQIIYQIRCNLIHGEKIPYGTNDQKIVEAAYGVLEKFLIRPFEPFIQ